MTSKAIRYINSSSRTSSAFLSLGCHVKPNANRNREGIISVTDEHIELCVTAQPKNGEANTAVCKLLAEVLGVAKTDVEIIKGLKSRYKTVSIPLHGTPDVNRYLEDVKRKLQGAIVAQNQPYLRTQRLPP